MSRVTNVSLELSGVIEDLIEASVLPPRATLGDVRGVVNGDGLFVSAQGELLHPQDRTSLVIEVDELIDRYGDRATARGFTSF